VCVCVCVCVTALVPPAPLMPPVGVDALVLSATSVMLSWSDSWSPVSASDRAVYTVRCARSTLPGRYRYVNATTTTARLDRLRPHSEYEMSVRVSRGRRQSTWSMSVLVTTRQARTSYVLLGALLRRSVSFRLIFKNKLAVQRAVTYNSGR